MGFCSCTAAELLLHLPKRKALQSKAQLSYVTQVRTIRFSFLIEDVFNPRHSQRRGKVTNKNDGFKR